LEKNDEIPIATLKKYLAEAHVQKTFMLKQAGLASL